MTKEEIECLQKAGYLSFSYDNTLYVNGSPVATFDPISPMICQSNRIAYDMADLANANFSALHTEQAARMDDICTRFATPYNEPRRESNAYVQLKPKSVHEDFWDYLDNLTQSDISNAIWWSFIFGVLVPDCAVWLICDYFLPFF